MNQPAHIARHADDIGIDSADLYAGLGGFSEGAKQAGVRGVIGQVAAAL